jgi:peptidoglycan/LPS O-acetylase OafA/YrhL
MHVKKLRTKLPDPTPQRAVIMDWYPSLNGLRAISITLVILHHLGKNTSIFKGISTHRWLMPLIRFIQDGQLGVNIFFVISGFLITSLLLKEEERTQAVSIRQFFLKRVLRIFPAYYFMLFVYVVLNAMGLIHISGASFLTAFTFTKHFNWSLDWFTAHGWSLSIEETFYLCWPAIFISGNRFRKAAVWALIALVPLCRIFVHFYPLSWMSELSIFWRIDAIATGCLLALYKDRILNILSPHWKGLFWFSILALFGLRYFQSLASLVHAGFIFIPLGLTNGSIANALIGIILMYSVFGPQKYWFTFLNLRWVNFIGTISFSIYLWQQLFISGIDWWIAQFPQNLVAIAVMALFSYYIIEAPFLRLKTKLATVHRSNVRHWLAARLGSVRHKR